MSVLKHIIILYVEQLTDPEMVKRMMMKVVRAALSYRPPLFSWICSYNKKMLVGTRM